MSVFWRYFHDALHWPQIFHPGPLAAIIKGLAAHMDDVREDILWLRRQYAPPRAEDALLPGYGESRGVRRWSCDTDATYRARVINAHVWHKLGGKVRGLEQIYAENGIAALVLPALDPALWAHFRVICDVSGDCFPPSTAKLTWLLANEYKPARSKLDAVVTRTTCPVTVSIAVGLRHHTRVHCRLYFEPSPIAPAVTRIGVGLKSVTRSRAHVYFPPQETPSEQRHHGMCLSGVTTIVIVAHQ